MNETHLILRSIQSLLMQSRRELHDQLYGHVLHFVLVTARLHMAHTVNTQNAAMILTANMGMWRM
jgi:hypothetical protein